MSLTPDPTPPPPPLPPPASLSAQPAQSRSPVEDPVWGGVDVLLILLVAVTLVFFCSLAAFSLAAHFYRLRGQALIELSRNPKVLVPAQGFAYLFLLLFMQLLLARRYRAPFWRTIGWNFPAGPVWTAWLSAGVVMAFAIQFLSSFLPVPPSLPIDQYFRDPASAWILSGFGILVAPLVEELFYRGFLYPVLARRVGMLWGVVLTAIPFALMHTQQLAGAWAPLLLLFLVGAALTLVRAYTGSVAASVLTHMAYNTTLFTTLFFASDHFRHLEKAL